MKELVYIFVLCFVGSIAQAQYLPRLTQYTTSQYSINPALVGGQEVLKVNGVFRKNFASMPGSPRNILLSAAMPVGYFYGGGLQLQQYTIGNFNVFRAGLAAAGRMRLGDYRLSLGFLPSIIHYNMRPDKLLIRDDGDPHFLNSLSQAKFNLSIGAAVTAKSWNAGVVMQDMLLHNITTTLLSTIYVSQRTILYYATYYYTYQDLTFSPFVNVYQPMGSSIVMDFGLSLISDVNWTIATLYRNVGELALILKYDYKMYSISYSYDIGLKSQLSGLGGSHEIGLAYNKPLQRKRNISPR